MKKILLSTLTVILIAAPLYAQDKVFLKSGQVLEGKVTKDDPKEVVLQLPDGSLVAFGRDQVEKIAIQEPEVYTKANQLFSKGAVKEALDLYKKITEIYAGNEWADVSGFQMGLCYEKLNKWDESAKIYQALLKDKPDGKYAPRARLGLAEAYMQSKRYKEALEIYSDISQKEKGETAAWAYNGIGECYYQNKEYEKALESGFLPVAVLFYDFENQAGRALFMSGECRKELGETAQALEYYEELIKRYPKNAHAAEANKRIKELKK
jgi:TolA-binding protein